MIFKNKKLIQQAAVLDAPISTALIVTINFYI